MSGAGVGAGVFLSLSFQLVLPSLFYFVGPNIPHVAQKIASLRDKPKGNGIWANVLGALEESLAAPLRSTPPLNLGNPDIFSKSCTVAIELASCPHIKCHLHAGAMGVKSLSDARKWIAGQVAIHVPDREWAASASSSRESSNELECVDFRCMCPTDNPRIIGHLEYRLPASHGARPLGSGAQPNLQHNGSPTSRIYWSVAARNIDRIRRRGLRPHASPLSQTIGPISIEHGATLQAPSDDDVNSVARHVALFLPPPFNSADSAFETQRARVAAAVACALRQVTEVPGHGRWGARRHSCRPNDPACAAQCGITRLPWPGSERRRVRLSAMCCICVRICPVAPLRSR